MREHGGTIQVNNEPGRFTDMVIELPLEPPARLGADAQAQDQAVPRRLRLPSLDLMD